jgi:circadian clock protein KaiC
VQLTSGLPELDTLLGGGLEEGTSTLIAGPPGTGKSSLAAQFVTAAANRGQSSAMFLFEEAANNLLNRADGLGMEIRKPYESGMLTHSADRPRRAVARRVFQRGVPGRRPRLQGRRHRQHQRLPQRHAGRALPDHSPARAADLPGPARRRDHPGGCAAGHAGRQMSTTVDASYLADNVLMLRYFEHDGEVKQAVSVFKKRGSLHERTIRQFSMSRERHPRGRAAARLPRHPDGGAGVYGNGSETGAPRESE